MTLFNEEVEHPLAENIKSYFVPEAVFEHQSIIPQVTCSSTRCIFSDDAR